MTQALNPYHKWLGIPVEDQPPHHYRLLGISPFESDPDVIDAAADRQMSHVQTYKTGPHSALSQELLNELAAAKLCLLVADKKAAYDRQLKAALNQGQRAASAAETRLPRAAPLIAPEPAPPRTATLKTSALQKTAVAASAPAPRSRSPLLLGSVAVAAIGLVVIVAIVGSSGPDPKAAAEPPRIAANDSKPAPPATPTPPAPPPRRTSLRLRTTPRLNCRRWLPGRGSSPCRSSRSKRARN